MRSDTLSVAIIAKDEERLIGGCLESLVGVADEVVVLLDSRSRDRTEALCRANGATLFIEPWRGYAAQRNRALQLCQGEWVLFIDADERLLPQLRQHIEALHPPDHVAGYWIPRFNMFFNQVVRGGGWYPDEQLRLIRRTQAHYDETRMVHEVVHVDGDTEHLTEHLLHINIEYVGEFWRKQASYALSEARTLHMQGTRTRMRNFVGAPAREFWRRYVQLGGWRDGAVGLFLCASLAWFEIVRYGCLLVIQDKELTHR